MAGREGVICLLPDCPGGVVSNRLQGAYITREGKASLASLRGGQGGRVKRKHGFDFPDKAAAAAPSHLPARRMSPGYLRLSALAGLPAAPAAALLRARGCRLPPAARPLRAGMEPAKGKGAERGGFSSSSHLGV